MEKKKICISDWDEWYGPLYTCPFCTNKHIWDDYKFCPDCGGNLEGFKFETVEEHKKGMKKENERIPKTNAATPSRRSDINTGVKHHE